MPFHNNSYATIGPSLLDQGVVPRLGLLGVLGRLGAAPAAPCSTPTPCFASQGGGRGAADTRPPQPAHPTRTNYTTFPTRYALPNRNYCAVLTPMLWHPG